MLCGQSRRVAAPHFFAKVFPQLQTVWIADAHRDDGKRFVVHGDEKVTAFMELGSAVHASTRRSVIQSM